MFVWTFDGVCEAVFTAVGLVILAFFWIRVQLIKRAARKPKP